MEDISAKIETIKREATAEAGKTEEEGEVVSSSEHDDSTDDDVSLNITADDSKHLKEESVAIVDVVTESRAEDAADKSNIDDDGENIIVDVIASDHNSAAAGGSTKDVTEIVVETTTATDEIVDVMASDKVDVTINDDDVVPVIHLVASFYVCKVSI